MYPREREKNQKLKDSRCHSLAKKTKEPCIGFYQDEKARSKTQDRRKEFIFSKSKRVCKFDEWALKKKFVPGIGKYEGKEKSIERLSNPPMALRRRR